VRGTFLVGFDSTETTGSTIEALLPFRTSRPPPEYGPAPVPSAGTARVPIASAPAASEKAPLAPEPSATPPEPQPALPATSEKAPPAREASPTSLERGPALVPGSETPRIPTVTSRPSASEGELPWFGRVSAKKLGMPAFTVAVGLVDGFNPCAMWVLMFRLALFVNVRSRTRMLAIAGTFVVVSGFAYFAFMAAWLNVFHLIGLSRAVQIFAPQALVW
jgi:hypothetical protein